MVECIEFDCAAFVRFGGFGVWGLGFRVGLGFRKVWGLGFMGFLGFRAFGVSEGLGLGFVAFRV